MKVDFHVHSKYSHDCSAEIGEILQYAKRYGLDAIAIADHDTLEGSRQARMMRTSNDVEIIPAIEFTLPAGEFGVHIVAANIDEYIRFNDVVSAIEALKERGATIILPHPFREGTGLFYHQEKGYLTDEEVKYVLDNIDYIEVLNLKDTCSAVQKTLQYVAETRYPIISGTDAHFAEYVGMTYTTIADLESFFNGIESGVVEAFIKQGSAPQLHDFHKVLETGNDSHYFKSLVEAARQPFSDNSSDKKVGCHERRASAARVFKDALQVSIRTANNELQVLSGCGHDA